jgi:hypothetical protein
MRSIRKGCRKIHRRESLVEEVLSPLLVAVADQAHQLPGSVQGKRTWAALELQPGLFGSTITFAVVALVAASHKVFPRRASPARTRHHVVERKLRRRKSVRAELASVAVAQKDVFSPPETRTTHGGENQ